MLDQSYIGKKLPTIRYQVDASKIRELALALGDDNPIFTTRPPRRRPATQTSSRH
jgi:hypothetical protein